MAGRYLTELADVVRGAGLACREYQGWQTRARGSGGYAAGRPTHVMIHHTASGPSWDGQPDADYCAVGSPVAPISNLYIDRSGTVWVLAAGATNTNGNGSDWWGGGVPDDSMNTYAIGIEAGNTGVGEPWSGAQQDAYVRLCRALCSRYGISYTLVRAHHEWRQSNIDPAGPSQWATGTARWNMEAFRATVAAVAPPPPPSGGDEEDDMKAQVIKGDGSDSYYAWDGVRLGGIPSLEWVQWGYEAGLYQNTDPVLYPQGFVDQLLTEQAP